MLAETGYDILSKSSASLWKTFAQRRFSPQLSRSRGRNIIKLPFICAYLGSVSAHGAYDGKVR